MSRVCLFWCIAGCAALLALSWWAIQAMRPLVPAPLTKEQSLALARSARRVVAAVYQYKEDVGLWPLALGDLPERERPEVPDRWHYKWFQHGSWSLTCYAGYPQGVLRFSYSEGSGEWIETDGDWNEPLKGAPSAPVPRPADPEARSQRMVEELASRVVREPIQLGHRQKLIAELVRRGELRRASAACASCPDPIPKDWWPQETWWPPLALAIIDSKDGRGAKGEARLRAWAEEKGEFGYYFLLAHFLDLAGHPERASEALEVGARLPVRDFPDRHWMKWLVWEATDRLYRENRQKAALALCEQWEVYRRRRDTMDPSYLTYRAASLLALGQFEEAERAMKAVEEAGLSIKWADNTESLGEAIKRRDKGFCYEPKERPRPFTWEVDYE